MFDKCVKCEEANLRDYPTCVNCESKAHIATQEYCRCIREDCQRKRRIAQTDAQYRLDIAKTLALGLADEPVLQEAARRIVAHYAGMVGAVADSDWCEPCFTDNCKHVVSTY